MCYVLVDSFIQQGVMAPQAWSKETELLLLDSKVLTLPCGIKPATPTSPRYKFLWYNYKPLRFQQYAQLSTRYLMVKNKRSKVRRAGML
jgi:hypothetical protein